MLNEGTYPYYKGGVSTWNHSLISGLGDFEYLVLTLTTKPPLKSLYPKPPNVQSFGAYRSGGRNTSGSICQTSRSGG